MVLGLGKGGEGRDADIPSLINKKQYAKAIELLKAQLSGGRPDDRSRLQLADVLVLAGKSREAVQVLSLLADEYAKDGFAAKAISVLKRIEKIEPGRRDVAQKLASLIESKQRQATVASPAPSLEIGMEEIGFEAPGVESLSVPADPIAAPEPDAPELAMEAPQEEAVEPFVLAEGEALNLAAVEPDDPPAPEISLEPEAAARSAPLPSPVEDRDLMLEEEGIEDLPEIEPEIEAQIEPEAVEPEAVEPEAVEPEVEMSEATFAEELLSLVDGAFGASAPEPESPSSAQEGGQQIVVSPLFRDFSVDELVAVIQGLTLTTFEAGDIILSEGDPGDSLYMLTSGSVKVLRKDAKGKQVGVGVLTEGAFFGEGSILTGRPRTATVVARTRCEMLELDRATLDGIVETHPRVRDILEEFARTRARPRAPISAPRAAG
jgi:hypothetical protein